MRGELRRQGASSAGAAVVTVTVTVTVTPYCSSVCVLCTLCLDAPPHLLVPRRVKDADLQFIFPAPDKIRSKLIWKIRSKIEWTKERKRKKKALTKRDKQEALLQDIGTLKARFRVQAARSKPPGAGSWLAATQPALQRRAAARASALSRARHSTRSGRRPKEAARPSAY